MNIEDERKKVIDSFPSAERRSLEEHLRRWEEGLNANKFDFETVKKEITQSYPDSLRGIDVSLYIQVFLKTIEQSTKSQPLTPTSLSKFESLQDNEEEFIDGAIPSIRQQPVKPKWMEKSAVDLLEDDIHNIIHGTSVAPFIFLLQSMGYGKTKAVWDLAKKRRVVYLPCKDIPTYSGDGGWWRVPPSLRTMIDFLQDKRNEETCEYKWTKFLKGVKELAFSYNSEKDLYDAQITEDGKLGAFYDRLTYNPNGSPIDQRSPISILRRTQAEGGEKTKKRKIDNGTVVAFQSYHDATPVDDSSLVVCLDEATAISTASFRAFRLAAKHLGIIVIFSDTTASISKMAPSKDASCSRNGGDIGNLSLPIYQIPNFDLEWNPDSDVQNLEHLFKAGRPRWSSLLRIADGEVAADDDLRMMVEEVKKILTRNDTVDEDDKNQLEVAVSESETCGLSHVLPSMIAVFTCRFGLEDSSKIGSLLAKYNLATITHVSSDRKIIHTHFPSEPVLAEASAQYTMDSLKMGDVLEHVHAAVLGGLLSPPQGNLGEMCAAAILGFTMDKIRRRNIGDDLFFSRSVVDLHGFLVEFGLDPSDKTLRDVLDGWKVNFTHFVRSGSLDKRDLKPMWLRRKAYYVAENMEGLDLLIVIWHIDHGYATLRVQVKNRKNFTNSNRKNAFTRLAPKVCPPLVPEEKLSVCLLLCKNVEHDCSLWDYNLKRQLHPKKRSSPRTENVKGRHCLRLASPFVTGSNNDENFAKKLLEICRDGDEKPEYWRVDEASTNWEKSQQKE